MPLRAAVLIALKIEDEVLLPIEVGPVREVGERHIGPDARVLDGHDVLGGAVLGIARNRMGPDLSAKADAPQQVPHGLVLHDIGRCHEGGEDDPALTPVDDVMVVVAQANGTPVPHG